MFWRLTLREVQNIMHGHETRLKREHNERVWLAWHIEALQRTKKLPKLKDMMSGASAAPRKQTVDEQVAIAMQWVAVTKH